MDSITCQEKVPYSTEVMREGSQYFLPQHHNSLQISLLAFTASYTYPPVYFLTYIATPKPLQWLPIAQDEIKHGLQSYP